MSRKVLGRIIVCALALAMVLGLCTMASLADTGWGAEISSGKQDGVIGRTITIKVTGGSTAGTYTFDVKPTGTAETDSVISVSNNNSTTFTLTPNVAGTGSVTIAASTVAGNVAEGSKTITFTTRTPVLALKSSSAIYDCDGNSFTVSITDPAEDGSLQVTKSTSGKGVVKSVIGNTVTVQGADSYTIDYVDQSGNSYVGSAKKIYNVTKQKAVLAISNDNVTLATGTSVTLDYDTTSSNASITPAYSVSGAVTANVDRTNKQITITAGSSVGSYSVTFTDDGDDNYSSSSPVGVVVNVVDPKSTIIKVTPNYIKLDKDTSAKKVNISISNAVYDDGVAEVNIKVLKPTGTAYRGVYIDGVRKSAGNTYKVASSGSVNFDVTLKARYSGSYTLKVTNGNNSVTFPVYITGYNTLPQTGPDYSMVYIFAALLTVALGGIVLVNVLRKKDENIK